MSLKNSIDRIKVWAKQNAPELFAVIAKPASKSAIAKTVAAYAKEGYEFPTSLRQYLSIMNGQTDDMTDDGFGLIPRGDDPYKLHSTRMFVNDIGFAESFPSEKYQCAKGINPCSFDPGWFPFATDWNSVLVVDTAPSTDGVSGQIVAVDFDSPIRVVIADSIESFFERLAAGYENGDFEWTGTVVTPHSKDCFPFLNNLSALLVKPLVAPEIPVNPKGKYLVTIEAIVSIKSLSNRPIRARKKLRQLDGQFTTDTTRKYLDEQNIALVSDGGEIRLRYDADSNCVYAMTKFGCMKKLTKKQLTDLESDTIGQWSDGLGSSFADDLERERELKVDLCPLDREVSVTQIKSEW